MTSSSSIQRGLDTPILVYSLLQGHPASTACEQFIRSHGGWFTTVPALLEAKVVLTKTYGVAPADASRRLTQFAAGPVALVEVDAAMALSAMGLADSLKIDLNDAVFLKFALQQGVTWIATEDQHFAQVCAQLGMVTQSPLDTGLRQIVAAWEGTHLPPKGSVRMLRRIFEWLNQSYGQAAQDFWSQTGGANHLP